MAPSLVLSILGPTASGKSALALELAEKLDAELICLDSTTVYRGFDIGTGKPTKADQAKIPHHLLDVMDPEEDFTAFDFVKRAEAALDDVISRGKIPLVVGGTYFYLRALQNGMFPGVDVPDTIREAIETRYETEGADPHGDLKKCDPKAAEKIHPNDRYRLLRALAIFEATGKKVSELTPESRPGPSRLWIKYAVLTPRHTVHRRIEQRTDWMIQGGWVDEVRQLRQSYPKARALGSIGYASVCAHLDEKLSEVQMRNQIIERTRQLAKRQITWLRGDPDIRFVDLQDQKRILQECHNLRQALGEHE